MVEVISTDSMPHIEIPPDERNDKADTVATRDSSDPAARALLFGRYSGQIQARIERAWRRPRTPVGQATLARGNATPEDHRSSADDTFRCQVRILQDLHGAVQEVQMLDCSDNAIWQHSLVTAILASSPLPAPPSPTVFSQALNMTFEGHDFTANSAPDEYDIDRTHASAAPLNSCLQVAAKYQGSQ